MAHSDEMPRHSVSVAAAIVDDHGRVLAIQRRDTGAFEPPGGVLELDETIPEGLRREVREETGLDVEPVRLTGIYKNLTRGIVALVFRCAAVGGTPTVTDETAAFRWLARDEIDWLVRERRMAEAFAVRLRDALDAPGVSCGRVRVRAHDGVTLLDGHG